MLGWVVLGQDPTVSTGPRGYNSVNYHLIYYGKRGNLWHGECMRSIECLLVCYVFLCFCWVFYFCSHFCYCIICVLWLLFSYLFPDCPEESHARCMPTCVAYPSSHIILSISGIYLLISIHNIIHKSYLKFRCTR